MCALAVLCASFLRFGGKFLYFNQKIGWGDATIKEETIPAKSRHHGNEEDGAKKKTTQKELYCAMYLMTTFLFTRPMQSSGVAGRGVQGNAQCCEICPPRDFCISSPPHTQLFLGGIWRIVVHQNRVYCRSKPAISCYPLGGCKQSKKRKYRVTDDDFEKIFPPRSSHFLVKDLNNFHFFSKKCDDLGRKIFSKSSSMTLCFLFFDCLHPPSV